MNNTKDINICSPGYGSSCALCCGSHNYCLTREKLNELYHLRSQQSIKKIHNNVKSFQCSDDIIDGDLPKKLEDGIQCPFTGFISVDTNKIGCLIYMNEDKPDLIKEFFKDTCSTFFCPSKEILSDKEIIFAAKVMGDWYFYSLLINEISYLKMLYKRYKDPESIPNEQKIEIQMELTKRFELQIFKTVPNSSTS